MNKKDLIQLAVLGLSAGMCLSGQSVRQEKNQEIAMAKCSKEPTVVEPGAACSGENDCNDQGTGCGGTCNGNQSKSNEVKPRRSAAQKVIYGE